jgi:hypothetical protein
MDIILGMGGNAILSGHWRAFALGHRLRIGDHLVFRFKLGALEASVQIFPATEGLRGGGELVSSLLLKSCPRRRGMPRRAFDLSPVGD